MNELFERYLALKEKATEASQEFEEGCSVQEPKEANRVMLAKFMITNQDEADLRALGYSQEDIYRMKPAEAQRILDDAAKVKGMTWEEFSRSSFVMEIYSAILGERVLVAPNTEVAARVKDEGLVIYLPEEILAMKGLSPEERRKVHMIKKEMGGRLEAIIPSFHLRENTPLMGLSGANLRQSEG